MNIYEQIRLLLFDLETLPDHEARIAYDKMDSAQDWVGNWLVAYDELAPDWSLAPESATWYTIDGSFAGYHDVEPAEGKTTWTIPIHLSGLVTAWKRDAEVPLGIDWRLCKWERPEPNREEIAVFKGELERIMGKYPHLHNFGYGGDDETDESKRTLANVKSVKAFIRAYRWIYGNLKATKSINRKHTSYGLKHLAEEEIGYITNGVFIAAMLINGFRMTTNGRNPNFNVSEWSCRQAEKRVAAIQFDRKLRR